MKRTGIVVLWWLCTVCWIRSAGQVLPEANTVGFISQRMIYTPIMGGEKLITNQMFSEIALRLVTDPRTIELSTQFKLTKSVKKAPGDGFVATIQLDEGEIKGSLSYNGFDFATSFEPNYANFVVIIRNQSNRILSQEAFSRVKISYGRGTPVSFRFHPMPDDTLSIEIRDLHFYHDPIALNRLLFRMNQADNYYAAKEILTLTEERLSKLSCKKPDQLPEDYLTLIEADRVIRFIEESNFQSTLSLGVSDPHMLVRRVDIAKNTVHLLLTTANATHASNKSIYPAFSDEEYIEKFIEGITFYLDNSSSFGFRSGPYLQRLSQVNFQTPGLSTALAILKEINRKIVPGTSRKLTDSEILQKTYDRMFQLASEYNQNEDYIRAAIMIENAERFCTAVQAVRCRNESFNNLAVAKNGVYEAYLSVADRALSVRKPLIARNYIFMARDYQRENVKFIPGDFQVTVMLVRLFDAFVEEAAQYNALQSYDTAMMLLQRALSPEIGITPSSQWVQQTTIATNGIFGNMLADLERVKSTDSMLLFETAYNLAVAFMNQHFEEIKLNESNRLRFETISHEYMRMLKRNAMDHLEKGYTREAMNKLLRIKQVSSFVRYVDQENEARIRKTGCIIINENLDNMVARINQGEMDGFEEDIGKIYDLQIKYGLSDNQELSDRIDRVKKAWTSIRCEQICSEAQTQLVKATNYINAGDYATGVGIYRSAVNLAESLPMCTCSSYSGLTPQYFQAAEYQEILNKLTKAYQNRDYPSVISLLSKAGELQKTFNPAIYALPAVNMIKFLTTNKDNNLYWFALRHYIKLQLPDEALSVLILMNQTGVPSSHTQDVQKEVARMLASRDRHSISCFGVGKKVKEYTQQQKWFRTFGLTYRRHMGFCLIRQWRPKPTPESQASFRYDPMQADVTH